MRKFTFLRLAPALLCVIFTFSLSCCSKKPLSKPNDLRITDIRIGTGDTDITTGTIVFNSDERILITFDVKNFTLLKENSLVGAGNNYYWIRQDLIMRDKDGGVVTIKPALIDGKEPLYTKPLKFKNSVNLPEVAGLKPGRYTVTLLVTDMISFQTATEDVPVKIK